MPPMPSPAYLWGGPLVSATTSLFSQIVCSNNGQNMVATDGTNIYLSQNFGRGWSPPKPANTLAPGMFPTSITSIACDGTGLNIFIAANDGISSWPILVSSDGGVTFSGSNSPYSLLWAAVACDPTGTYICATDTAATSAWYTTTGASGTWTQVVAAGLSGTFTNIMAMSGFNSSTGGTSIYTTDSTGAFNYSNDSGATWAVTSPVPWIGVNFIACNTSNSLVYVTGPTSGPGGPSVFVSTDGGATFSSISSSPNTNGACISCDSTGNNILLSDFTAGTGFTYFSNDAGITWTQQSSITNGGVGNDIVLISPDASNLFSVVVGTSFGLFVYPPPPITCYKEDSKILCLVDGKEAYVPVQTLRKGHMVKTALNGYKPIDMIGYQRIQHPGSEERIKEQLYVCSHTNYPEVFEDLVITGCHCILVDEFSCEEERARTIGVNGKIFITGNKYRLPACVDRRTAVYEAKGEHTVYHFALENEDMRMNYGVYANGLLVETCSKRHLQEWKNMTLIE